MATAAQSVEVVQRAPDGRWLPGASGNPAGGVSIVTDAMREEIRRALWECDSYREIAERVGVAKSTVLRAVGNDGELQEIAQKALRAKRLARATEFGTLATRALDRLKRDIDDAPAKDAQALSIAAGVLSDNEAKAAGLTGGPSIQVRLGWTDNAFGAEVRVGG